MCPQRSFPATPPLSPLLISEHTVLISYHRLWALCYNIIACVSIFIILGIPLGQEVFILTPRRVVGPWFLCHTFVSSKWAANLLVVYCLIRLNKRLRQCGWRWKEEVSFKKSLWGGMKIEEHIRCGNRESLLSAGVPRGWEDGEPWWVHLGTCQVSKVFGVSPERNR